jgi:glycosyltransferase involved in cell wall biosynthesis
LPVRFLGERDHNFVARALAAADLFVFPSTSDTLGLVLLEALASGLPIVSAESPSSRGLLAGLPWAAVFDPDAPTSLLAAVERVTSSGVDRRFRRAAVRDRLLDWEAATGIVEEAYMEACHRRKQRLTA